LIAAASAEWSSSTVASSLPNGARSDIVFADWTWFTVASSLPTEVHPSWLHHCQLTSALLIDIHPCNVTAASLGFVDWCILLDGVPALATADYCSWHSLKSTNDSLSTQIYVTLSCITQATDLNAQEPYDAGEMLRRPTGAGGERSSLSGLIRECSSLFALSSALPS